ncbi:hypothetical protein PAPYR_4567 [Paratrimastix pyriformis]|uniref:Uncharacterized protein n=1 Tax=Paratrimastix pyriformis TaxID=342808 RepID=A0ABQ8URY9_9EUKA|nr:hypothetical protein PAPYR_4567 [Paratrimastix pyriformis]
MERCPPEILWLIAAHLPSVRSYCLFTGLCHHTRHVMRGTALTLTFNDGPVEGRDSFPIPPADAMAALLGPCTQLREITFASDYVTKGCGWHESTFGPWVDASFKGHDKLRVLRLPVRQGLEELYLGDDEHDYARAGQALAGAIGANCPNLRSLVWMDDSLGDLDLSPLRGCAASLQRLTVACGEDRLGQALSLFPNLDFFHAPNIDIVLARASPTIHATDSLDSVLTAGRAARCRLVEVRIPSGQPSFARPLVPFLTGTLGTLTRVDLLGRSRAVLIKVIPLLAVPSSAPALQTVRLTELDLQAPLPCPEALLGLINRVEHFTMQNNCGHGTVFRNLVVRSARLRTLDLLGDIEGPCLIECPALVSLDFPQPAPLLAGGVFAPLRLRCPALEVLSIEAAQPLSPMDEVGGGASEEGPLCPRLRRLELRGDDTECPWLARLPQWFPSLGRLTLGIGRPETFDLLWMLPCLSHLECTVRYAATREWHLRHGGGVGAAPLARLEVHVADTSPELSLVDISSPTLSWLALSCPGKRLDRVALGGCPSLAEVAIRCDARHIEMPPAPLPLRRLTISGAPFLDPADLERILLAGADQLRSVALWNEDPDHQPWDLTALAALIPRLRCLYELGISGATSPSVSFASPSLGVVALRWAATTHLSLAGCPALEYVFLSGSAKLAQIEMSPSLPYLLMVATEGVPVQGKASLKSQCPSGCRWEWASDDKEKSSSSVS